MHLQVEEDYLTAAKPTSRKHRRKRIIIYSCIALVCVLLLIHHIKLEVENRRCGPEGGRGLEGPEGPIGPGGPLASRGKMSRNGTAAKRLASVERRLNSVLSSLGWDTCGGLVDMIGSERELVYKVQTVGKRADCMWVVSARASGSTVLSIVQDSVIHFNPAFSLKVFEIWNYYSCNMTSISWTGGDVTIRSQIFFVYFSGQASVEGEGFRLRLVTDRDEVIPWSLSYTKKTSSFAYKYPPAAHFYSVNRKLALLGTPPHGRRATVTIYDVSTEDTYDYVTLLYPDPSLPRGYFCERRSGANASSTIVATVPSGLPFIIYFRSDSSINGRGFRANSSYDGE